jgi:putative SOS response-associated peptidase YedK
VIHIGEEWDDLRQIVEEAQRRADALELADTSEPQQLELFPKPKLVQVKAGEMFPGDIAPVLIPRDEYLEAHPMIWGYPNPRQQTGVIFNARIEQAGERPLWRESIATRRCIVPMSGFYEWRQGGTARGDDAYDDTQPRGRRYLFELASEPILYLAGIYQSFIPTGLLASSIASGSDSNGGTPDTSHILTTHFSIMTTWPNASMSGIHDRMPVILRSDDLGEWLFGDYHSLANQRGIELEHTLVP